MRAGIVPAALTALPVVSWSTPAPVLRRMLREGLKDLHLALCLHRVSSRRRPTEVLPEVTIDPAELDRLIEILLESRPGDRSWLSISFDDGYDDAAEYILERAPRYPEAEWLFFVCPEKIEKRAGFRWDLYETARPELELEAFLESDPDRDRENDRPELRALADDHDFRIATADRCRELASLPNVSLGNHTNNHFRIGALEPAVARAELDQSISDFERLFGPCRHFAFPYGAPVRDWTVTHAAHLRDLGLETIWSTGWQPYSSQSRALREVLPRIPIDGGWSAKSSALWIALTSARARTFGRRMH